MPLTPSDPSGQYVYGRQLLHLTDLLRASTYTEAAVLVDHVTEPLDGLLERLADFFEAAGEKAKDSDHDDGFDLAATFEDAAATLRETNENLATAADKTRALGPQPRPDTISTPALGRPLPHPAATAPPGRSR